MNVLSVQSTVAYGHVGNAAAAFPLQRLGHEVWPVNTVNYSNHPGYGDYVGGIYRAGDVADILGAIEARGAFERCDAILTGFMGSADIGREVLAAIGRIKAANPEALFVLDPVMGDAERGIYVAEGLPRFFREEAMAKADIVVPNVFELAHLTGHTIKDIETAANAAQSLMRVGDSGDGPSMVVVTGLRHESEISVLLVTDGQAWQATTPLVNIPSWGAGDAFTALFLGSYFNLHDARAAVVRAVSSIYGLFVATEALNADALALIEGQKEIVNPSERFAALPVWSA